eukprot:5623-Pelagomonas_calceolata.AAC.9
MNPNWSFLESNFLVLAEELFRQVHLQRVMVTSSSVMLLVMLVLGNPISPKLTPLSACPVACSQTKMAIWPSGSSHYSRELWAAQICLCSDLAASHKTPLLEQSAVRDSADEQ